MEIAQHKKHIKQPDNRKVASLPTLFTTVRKKF